MIKYKSNFENSFKDHQFYESYSERLMNQSIDIQSFVIRLVAHSCLLRSNKTQTTHSYDEKVWSSMKEFEEV